MTSVAICVPTYKRPEFLADLLRGLATIDTAGLSARVIVVDNDADGSAADVVRRFAALIPELDYEIEPRRGISAARNRLVALATRAGADYVAFIDDDERPDRAWLSNLVQTAVAYAADVVGGPARPEYDPDVPSWVVKGGFFDPPPFPTGGRSMLTRGTSNLLLRRACLDRLDGPFDRRFDLTGGGDMLLLHRLARRGARMAWCAEAIVYEKVPATRAHTAWLIRRLFRVGLNRARRECLLDPGRRARLGRVRRPLRELGRGLRILPPSLCRGRAATVHALRRCAVGLGGLLGLLNVSIEDYRQVHGR